jgi:hypothetical protein
MQGEFDLLVALVETATDPMDRREILRRMKTEFSREELDGIVVGAGAALVVWGAKPTSTDIDCEVVSLKMLRSIAKKRGIELSRSMTNGSPRVEVGGFAELFYDPEVHAANSSGMGSGATVVVDGVRVETPEVLVRWYQYMVRIRGRRKDSENLKLAEGLLASRQ